MAVFRVPAWETTTKPRRISIMEALESEAMKDEREVLIGPTYLTLRICRTREFRPQSITGDRTRPWYRTYGEAGVLGKSIQSSIAHDLLSCHEMSTARTSCGEKCTYISTFDIGR